MTPEDLRRALGALTVVDHPALPGRTNHLRAGVLVPLVFSGSGDAECLVTLRAASLGQHAGEVSFPGGKPDPADGTLERTALREAEEELGIDGAEVLGRLASMPLYTSDWRLVPFVARVPPGPLTPEPGEVARVYRLSLRGWLSRPQLDGIPFDWEGQRVWSPIFPLDGCVMYGGTAHTFMELLRVAAPLLGLEVPPFVGGRFSWEDLLGP
jgi:8-oxo-dGTP pyrophosphatase MutT (NUDIX family)